MGGLAHYFELEGLPTTQISLIRMHTEQIRPPRALWVPFILGRPIGQPEDPDFQLRVVRHVLGLLERPASDAPILVDHLEDAAGDVALDGLACPMSYSPPESDGSLRSRLHDEIANLQNWHNLGLERTGRTAFGVSGLDIADIADAIVDAGDGILPESPSGREVGDHLRFAGEDLKAFLTEAAAAQPGDMTAYATKAWFWNQTAAAEALLAAYQVSSDSEDPLWPIQAPMLIPAELR